MKKSFNYKLFFCLLPLVMIIGFIAGAFGYLYINKPTGSDKLYGDDVNFIFMELGNVYAGDSFLIKSGDVELLVDAGSKTSSIPTLKSNLEKYVTDGVIEYTVVTHAHEDHYAGFAGDGNYASLFTYFKFETIIDFSNTNQKSTAPMYNRYLDSLNNEIKDGATHYNVLECYNNENGAKRTYSLGNNIEIEFLYQEFYENKASTENNYSVCFMINQGDKHFLFTGDLEDDGEKSLIENNDLKEVELFKAGHHGSSTSSTTELLNVIKPKNIVVTCVAGSVEYSQTLSNTFPTQEFINRIAPFTKNVYVTSVAQIKYNEAEKKYENVSYSSMNGEIIVTSKKDETIVNCSNNNTVLKDTDWFKLNREMPTSWAA